MAGKFKLLTFGLGGVFALGAGSYVAFFPKDTEKSENVKTTATRKRLEFSSLPPHGISSDRFCAIYYVSEFDMEVNHDSGENKYTYKEVERVFKSKKEAKEILGETGLQDSDLHEVHCDAGKRSYALGKFEDGQWWVTEVNDQNS